MRLVFSAAARSDLERLRAFIQTHNPDAAGRAAACIVEAANDLLAFPKLGKELNKRGHEHRELAFMFGTRGYVLRYRITSQAVRILRIWHGRENKP